MNGRFEKVLLDTNAVIDLLKGTPGFDEFFDKHLVNKLLAVSQITRMELLAFPGLKKSEEKSIRKFLDSIRVILLDENVEEEAILIRRSKKLKLPDAIIVATAKAYSCGLATKDDGILSKCETLGIETFSW